METTTFKYSGYDVEVADPELAEKVAEVVADGTYSIAALQKVAPGMMTALAREHQTCTDVGVEPESFLVKGGKVKAEVNPDRRSLKGGIRIGKL